MNFFGICSKIYATAITPLASTSLATTSSFHTSVLSLAAKNLLHVRF